MKLIFLGLGLAGIFWGGEKMRQWGSMKRAESKMVVYEFYRKIPGGDDRLIGVLPERRKDKERITHQSIMNWAKLLVPEQIFSDRVYFVRLENK